MSLTKVSHSMISGSFVSPLDYGAVGDGVTNDKAAIKAALESGIAVDGGGLTYAIDGTCTPTSFVGLQNANFIQIGNNSATDFQTLNIVGFSDFFIDNVNINMGSNITTLYSDDSASGLYVGGTQSGSGTGTTTTYIENFKITRVNVTGNGCGTGIQIRHAKRFNVDNCLVHDRVSGSSPDPTNDSQNGIEIVNSADFVMSNCEVYNLLTRLGGVDTLKWTRGFLFAEIRDCNIVGCNATSTDQNFDFSGGVSNTSPSTYKGNRQFTLSGCTSNNAGTWGFKFANVTHDGLITGCIANNSGGAGFVVSTQSTSIVLSNDSYRTQNLDFVGCKVVNVTGTSWAGMTPVGFKIDGDGTGAHSYPRNIRFIGCDVVDNQSSPTTVSGFDSGVVLPENATTGWNAAIANVVENCSSLNCTTFIGSTDRIGAPVCVVTSSTTQSLTTATWTQLNWNLDLSDPNYMHSVTNNNNYIVIRTPGWYRLTAQISFAANGTGSRQIRFTNNGTTIDRTTVEMNPDAGVDCYVQSTYIGYFETGRYVAVEGYQDSGGGLNANLNESNFIVEKVG